MKLHYFDQDIPDADDTAIVEMVTDGVVPPKCLRGGEIVKALHLAGCDPCADCRCPRERCGGRMSSVQFNDPESGGDSADVRKARRKTWIEKMLREMGDS